MKKRVVHDNRALRELRQFTLEVQEDFQGYSETLALEGRLEFPEARKIARNLFEIRLQHQGMYRGLYAYVREDFIVILHYFQKKSQKTPQRNILIAQQRAKQYE